jgi:transposase
METKEIIGIDISKLTFDARVNNINIEYGNNKIDIKKFIKATNNNAIFVMESTGTYGSLLADTLFDSGRIVYILNPASVHYFAKMQNKKAKTDKIDPKSIQNFAEQNLDQFRPYQKPSKAIAESREAITLLEHYKKQKNAIVNQIEAISAKGNGVNKHIKMLTNDLELVNANISKLEKELNDNMKNDHPDMYENISSIPSIGTTTAAMFIAITNGFLNFQTSKQLVSYLGACPVIVQSGTSIKKSYICKIGKSLMRNRLYMCALTAIKFNNMCKDSYERLLKRGVPKKKALMSIINKLIRQIFACATKEIKFDVSLNF